MKFVKSFYGCKTGEIYPTQLNVGDECPPELLDAAKAVGAVEVKQKPVKGGNNANSDD